MLTLRFPLLRDWKVGLYAIRLILNKCVKLRFAHWGGGGILMTNTLKQGLGVKNIKEKLVTSFMDSPWWVLFFSLLFLEFLEIWETLKRLWNGRNPIFIIHIKTAKNEKEKENQIYQGYLKYFFWLQNPNTYVLFIYV